jgi:hypothetical protein
MSMHRRSPFIVAWMFVLVALLATGVVPSALNAEAAKDASISITADKLIVNPGDKDTLHIKLQNVKNATLDGQALKGNKVDQKVQVCETTTYTVDATDDGGQKVSQSLTIRTGRGLPPPACLPDLAVKSMWATQAPLPGEPTREESDPNWIIENRGKTTAPTFDAILTDDEGGRWEFQVKSLKPGDTDYGYARWTPLHGTTTTFVLVLDPKNQVAESDKSNNLQSLTVTAQNDPLAPKNAPLAPGINLPGLTQP